MQPSNVQNILQKTHSKKKVWRGTNFAVVREVLRNNYRSRNLIGASLCCLLVALFARGLSWLAVASSPDPTKIIGKGAWCHLQKIPVCAKSAYYSTHPNSHISTGSLRLSHASALRNVIIGNGRTWFLYSKQRLLTQHIRESLQVTPGTFPDFWVGPGNEANALSQTWGSQYMLQC